MRDLLREIIENRPGDAHLEIRYHQRIMTKIRMDKGELRTANADDFSGVGIRTLIDGAWGYASTSKLDKESLNETMNNAISAARNLAPKMKEKLALAPIQPIEGTFLNLGKDPFDNHSFEEMVNLVKDTDKSVREKDERIKGSMVLFGIPQNHRYILNSDGTDVE